MSALTAFSFEGRDLRVLDRSGEPWFVAADVCGVLGIANPSDALKALDDDEKTTLGNTEGIARDGRAQALAIISESGLYTLILRSRKPEAKPFRRWVTHEVLPAIRRTGEYVQRVDLHPSAPVAFSVEDLRAVVREEVAAHLAGGDRIGDGRVYVTEFLAQCFGGAPIDKGVKLEFRRLVKAAAERAGVDVWRCGSEGTDRLYVEARHAAVLADAWHALRRHYRRLFEGVRYLPGIEQEGKAKHQKPTG